MKGGVQYGIKELILQAATRFAGKCSPMKNENYNLNRVVHLARRDAFLEKAFEVLRGPLAELPYRQRAQQIDLTLYYLQSAVEHGLLAAKVTPAEAAPAAKPTETSFLLFLRLVLSNLYAARVIMENVHALKDHKGHLAQFLQPNAKTNPLAGLEHEGEQLLQGTEQLLGLAEAPFGALRKTMAASLNTSDRQRYQKAYDGLKHHLETKSKQRAFIAGRIFSPIPEMKYE